LKFPGTLFSSFLKKACINQNFFGERTFPELYTLKFHTMKYYISLSICLLTATICFISCNNDKTTNEATKQPGIKEENVEYTADSISMNGFVAYDSGSAEKRPVVLVVHEWWGLNDYPKMRAKQLAEMGYLAMAVDMFGNRKTVDNPTDAQNMVSPFYQNPQMALNRLNAALAKVKTMPQADTTQVAAIGYCFGGGVLLNSARLGANLDGVVSFHGSLLGTPANKDLLKAKILVCQGGSDPFVPEKDVTAFKKSMDSIGADYTLKTYPNATHAFTNPNATAMGQKFNIPIAYNAAADSASWNDMKEFFGKIFK
jgi:dienelactone hydrolase